MQVDLNEKIPNNVNLPEDRRLQRALEKWQPNFLDWWMRDGAGGLPGRRRLPAHRDPRRTATGWAHFDYVKMPDYRWGIFLADAGTATARSASATTSASRSGRRCRASTATRCAGIIVTQGDTEPASVEQQRLLGQTAPSLYDLRNLFQVNVEEGRHLWAMVYLLHRYFGRDGREEAEELLERRSGDPDKPRILGAFNEPIDDWLSFFMFTMFTDRDGKYQLLALAESGFDPLSRTTRFMLTEEAHHMFVGETGVGRVVQRTCELMTSAGLRRATSAAHGGIDLPTIQKYLNFWFSLVARPVRRRDLVATPPTTSPPGLKGRAKEDDATRTTWRSRAPTRWTWPRTAARRPRRCRCATR